MNNITLCEIIREIPAVAAVLSAVPKADNDNWCRLYEHYKQILKTMVGYYAPEYDNEILNTDWAYDVVISALLDALDGVLELPEFRKVGA